MCVCIDVFFHVCRVTIFKKSLFCFNALYNKIRDYFFSISSNKIYHNNRNSNGDCRTRTWHFTNLKNLFSLLAKTERKKNWKIKHRIYLGSLDLGVYSGSGWSALLRRMRVTWPSDVGFEDAYESASKMLAPMQGGSCSVIII